MRPASHHLAKYLTAFGFIGLILTLSWRIGDWMGQQAGSLPATSEPFPTNTPVPRLVRITPRPRPRIRATPKPTLTPKPTSTLIPDIYEFKRWHTKSFSPDGNLIIMGGNIGFIKIYRRRDTKFLRKLAEPMGTLSSIAFSRDGKKLLTASSLPATNLQYSANEVDSRISLWDVKKGKKIHSFTTTGSPHHVVALSSDGRLYAFSNIFETALYRSSDGKQVWIDRPPISDITIANNVKDSKALTFSKDGKFLASLGGDGSVSIYRTQDGHLLVHRFFTFLPKQSNGLFFSTDGKALFIIATSVVLWRAVERHSRAT